MYRSSLRYSYLRLSSIVVGKEQIYTVRTIQIVLDAATLLFYVQLQYYSSPQLGESFSQTSD